MRRAKAKAGFKTAWLFQMKQRTRLPLTCRTWQHRSVVLCSQDAGTGRQWEGRLAARSTQPLGKEEGGWVSWREVKFYCFKLCMSCNVLPLCQQHIRWDICKAQLLCTLSPSTGGVPSTWDILHAERICLLLKQISFPGSQQQCMKSFHTSCHCYACLSDLLGTTS